MGWDVENFVFWSKRGMLNVRRWRLNMVKFKKKGSQIINQLWIMRNGKWMWDSYPFISLILSPK